MLAAVCLQAFVRVFARVPLWTCPWCSFSFGCVMKFSALFEAHDMNGGRHRWLSRGFTPKRKTEAAARHLVWGGRREEEEGGEGDEWRSERRYQWSRSWRRAWRSRCSCLGNDGAFSLGESRTAQCFFESHDLQAPVDSPPCKPQTWHLAHKLKTG